MKQNRLQIKARVSSRGDASSYLQKPGDAVIVERLGPRWLILSCPCGCGAELPVNLDRRAGPAWRLYESPKGISVYPSVRRDTDCESHFIIWRDKILLFGTREDDNSFDEPEAYRDDLIDLVLNVVSERFASTEEISDLIPGSVPWDILRSCRKLCRSGLVIEGRGNLAGHFRRS